MSNCTPSWVTIVLIAWVAVLTLLVGNEAWKLAAVQGYVEGRFNTRINQ